MEREYHNLLEHLGCNMELESPCGRVFVRSSGAGITLHVSSTDPLELQDDTITVECIKCDEVLIQIDKPTHRPVVLQPLNYKDTTTRGGPKRDMTPAANTEGKATFSIDEVAALLGIGRQNAYSLATRGKLPGAFRLGKRVLVSKAKFEAFLKGALNGYLDRS